MGKRVISQKAAGELIGMMEQVIQNGTGTAPSCRPSGGGQDRHHLQLSSMRGSSVLPGNMWPGSGWVMTTTSR